MTNIGLRTIAAVSVAVAVLGGCGQQPTAPSASPRSGSVWVADEGHDSITVIDASTTTTAMTLNGIKGPHNIQVSRDGAAVYAVSSAGLVVAIDPATYRVTATAPNLRTPK